MFADMNNLNIVFEVYCFIVLIRKIIILFMTSKCTSKLYITGYTSMNSQTNIKETRGHGYRLQKRMFHNDRHFYSFTNRAVDCWNALPNEIIYAKSFDAFSRGVKALDLAEFLKGVP